MQSEIAEDVGALPTLDDVKVHRLMCAELIELVKRASEMLLEIEASQPRCSSGMDALCRLSHAIDRAKSLIRDCSVSSKLYLALTGDTILARCKQSRNLLDQSLSEIQKAVPILLATKVSGVIADLREATFSLDPSEEAAGKVVLELLRQYASELDAVEETEFKGILVAALLLDITSEEAISTEKRSIKKLLDRLGKGERKKRKILLLLWNLLSKSGKVIMEEIKGEGSICHEDMNGLVSKWCVAHGVTIFDPSLQRTIHSLEFSSSSIHSLSCSVNALSLPTYFSNLSTGFSETVNNPETTRVDSRFSSNITVIEACDEPDVDLEHLSKLDSLSWESQLIVVENLKRAFRCADQDWDCVPYQDPLARFLRHALGIRDLKALVSGCLLWLTFVDKCRACIPCIDDDAYGLLASLIESEASKDALAILELLSCHKHEGRRTAVSGILVPLLNILDSQDRESHELVLNVLRNLSEDTEVCSLLVSSGLIPKLVPFFEDSGLARHCATIIRNLSCREDARVSLAETDGCFAFLAKLLDTECLEDQECAVAVLLSLCSHHRQYCQLVMYEGVIPGLNSISRKGTDEAKSMALKLLALLGDEICDNEESESPGNSFVEM